jgi:hypothetical protein
MGSKASDSNIIRIPHRDAGSVNGASRGRKQAVVIGVRPYISQNL